MSIRAATPAIIGALALLGGGLVPLACTSTESKGDKREKLEDTGEPQACDELECAPSASRDFQRYVCGECDKAYYGMRCLDRCEPCTETEYFWVHTGYSCDCITDDGLLKDVPECKADMDV